jgi:hypothetical protein
VEETGASQLERTSSATAVHDAGSTHTCVVQEASAWESVTWLPAAWAAVEHHRLGTPGGHLGECGACARGGAQRAGRNSCTRACVVTPKLAPVVRVTTCLFHKPCERHTGRPPGSAAESARVELRCRLQFGLAASSLALLSSRRAAEVGNEQRRFFLQQRREPLLAPDSQAPTSTDCVPPVARACIALAKCGAELWHAGVNFISR